MSWSSQLNELCVLLRRVGTEEVTNRFRRVGYSIKTDGSVVTEADFAVQQRISLELQDRWPELPLLGEEMTEDMQRQLLMQSKAGIWCLDPLDGTNNFAGGFPFFSLSLALIRHNETVLGLVYDPVHDECFAAERGGGAWLDGDRLILTHRNQELRDCLAVVDFKRLEAGLVQRLCEQAPYRSQRSLGSVALEWCWLAAGRFQLYLHGGQKMWDYAAGRLILEEAGGACCLQNPEGQGCRDDWDLAPRLGVASVQADLLTQWRSWLKL